MILKKVSLLLSMAFVTLSINLKAQQDSLTLNNNDVIVGTVKSMNKGVIIFETSYSDSDFQIDWDAVKKIKTKSKFLLNLSDGRRVNGTFSSTSDGKLLLIDEDGEQIEVSQEAIVYVNSLDEGFFSRLNANIDLGYSRTKANNQSQFTLNSRLSYLEDFWSLDVYYNSLLSRQDSINDIKRNDAGIGFRYFLPTDWYLSADVTFLSNTEQALDARINSKVGIGNYIIHTNKSYWGFNLGTASNVENFSEASGTEDKISWEGFIGSELNLYNIGDLNLFTTATFYPSLTESGRIRTDFRFDAKYDNFIFNDLYIRAGVTVNYDNQPAISGNETDYIFTTGFGWEW